MNQKSLTKQLKKLNECQERVELPLATNFVVKFFIYRLQLVFSVIHLSSRYCILICVFTENMTFILPICVEMFDFNDFCLTLLKLLNKRKEIILSE